MIRVEDFPQPRDGTVWRARNRPARRSPAIHPQADRLYYGRGPDQVAGYLWCEPDGGTGVVCLWQAELERVEASEEEHGEDLVDLLTRRATRG